MDAVEVAERYLKDRPVTAAHRGSVLRAARRIGTLEAGTINAYLNRRLSERSTITVRTERSILLTLWRYAWTLAGQAYLDWGQIRKTTPVVPRLMPQ